MSHLQHRNIVEINIFGKALLEPPVIHQRYHNQIVDSPCSTRFLASRCSIYAPDSLRVVLVLCILQPPGSVGPPYLINQTSYDELGLSSDRHEKADTRDTVHLFTSLARLVLDLKMGTVCL